MSEILKAVGMTAGIGGLALGVFLLLFRQIDLPKATRHHLTLFMWLVWSICVLGMAIYYMIMQDGSPATASALISSSTKPEASPRFAIRLHCGSPPPDEKSELAKLFEYAEQHEGKFAYVDLEFYPNGCTCDLPNISEPARILQFACNQNPAWWLKDRVKEFHCVEAIGLAGYLAGVGSLCFPSHDKLPLKSGYSRETTATHERIAGEFLLNWEWSLGAPHVQLLLPE